MWLPVTVTVAPASEPITLAQAKEQVRVIDDTSQDDLLNAYVVAARTHVEAVTGTKLVSQTVAMRAECWGDLERLPIGPVQSISSITYVDTAGDTQTLATSVYEARLEGLNPGIVLKYAQVWPSIRSGSLITVTAVAGYTTVPANIVHAVKLLVGDWFAAREDTNVGNIVNTMPHGVMSLLANCRRWAV
jgi:uncharacterized phiE125 gp8 family phage protein